VSNADDLSDLEGGFGNVGGGASIGGGVAGSGFGGWSERCGQPIVGGTFGIALGAGVTARITGTGTRILGRIGAPEQPCKSSVLR